MISELGDQSRRHHLRCSEGCGHGRLRHRQEGPRQVAGREHRVQPVPADGQHRVRHDGDGRGLPLHRPAGQVRGRQLEVQVRLRDPGGHAVQEDVGHLPGLHTERGDEAPRLLHDPHCLR